MALRVNHISRWIGMAVRRAYESQEKDLPESVRAHELRALSASWAYVNGYSLEDIKQSLYWRSDGVFQSSYLRNMSAVSAGLDRVGPVVAAGVVTR